MAQYRLRARRVPRNSEFDLASRKRLKPATGVLLGIALSAIIWAIILVSASHADPVDLTKAQRHEVVRINQDVNWRFAHNAVLARGWFGETLGRGQCAWLADQKRVLLIAAGIPAEALSLRDVMSPWGLHELLDVAGVGALDMNNDWPEDAAEERRMGYRATDQ